MINHGLSRGIRGGGLLTKPKASDQSSHGQCDTTDSQQPTKEAGIDGMSIEILVTDAASRELEGKNRASKGGGASAPCFALFKRKSERGGASAAFKSE
jgi:hypothetical protein